MPGPKQRKIRTVPHLRSRFLVVVLTQVFRIITLALAQRAATSLAERQLVSRCMPCTLAAGGAPEPRSVPISLKHRRWSHARTGTKHRPTGRQGRACCRGSSLGRKEKQA
jgi:hypothetical protein